MADNTTRRRRKALFLGNALLDISVECDPSLLDAYGLKEDDNCEAEQWQLPLFDALLAMPAVVTTPGGSAQNASRVAQHVLSASTGPHSVYFVGSVGRDRSGQILARALNACGVRAIYHYDGDEPTGVSAGLVTCSAKRTLMANIGASAELPQQFLEMSSVRHALSEAIICFVEGYFLTHSPISAMSLARFSQQLESNFFIGLSAVYVVTQHFEELMHLIQFADAVFANKAEAQTFYTHLTGFANCADIALIARTIARLDKSKPSHQLWPDVKRYVFITQGCDDVIAAKFMVSGEVVVSNYCVPKIEIRGDTIGAGDAFAGAIVAHLALGKSVDEAVVAAIDIAARVCQHRGCVLT